MVERYSPSRGDGGHCHSADTAPATEPVYLAHDPDLELGTAVRQKLQKLIHPALRRERRQVPRASPSRSLSEGSESAKGVSTKYDRL